MLLIVRFFQYDEVTGMAKGVKKKKTERMNDRLREMVTESNSSGRAEGT